MEKQNIGITIFFFVFAIGLALFIMVQGYSFFTGAKKDVNTTFQSSADCTAYNFEITGAQYVDNRLSFMLKNMDYANKDIENIIVKSGNSTSKIIITIPPGYEKEVSTEELSIGEEILVYVEGCKVYPKRIRI